MTELRSQKELIPDLLSADPQLPCEVPTESYWQRKPHVLAEKRSVSLPTETDVVIIGSGMTSLGVTKRLLSGDTSLQVAVLEARTLCSGATGRNGGQLAINAAETYEDLRATFGPGMAGAIVKFTIRTLERVREVIKEYGVDEAELGEVVKLRACMDQTTMEKMRKGVTQKTRDHFLPLITSTTWWSQTTLALKRVLQMDVDFQERMFAKQIAVMKGQAWNVVETLKTPDHGPLELTRRTRVCVWDDLVDVPVTVPMGATSSEVRRNPHARQSMDEADIASSAPAPNPPIEDLLGLASATADMPHPGRFELSSPTGETAQSPDEVPSSDSNLLGLAGQQQRGGELGERLTVQTVGFRNNYQGPARALNMYEPARQQQRRYSFVNAAARRNSNTIAQQYHETYNNDLEGDLGYAAAEGQMGNQRKVIVERLEVVKSRNPVFTCW